MKTTEVAASNVATAMTRGRKELQRILNLVVILSNLTVIYFLAAVRKKLLLSSLFTGMTPGCRSIDYTTLNRTTNVPCSGNAERTTFR